MGQDTCTISKSDVKSAAAEASKKNTLTVGGGVEASFDRVPVTVSGNVENTNTKVFTKSGSTESTTSQDITYTKGQITCMIIKSVMRRGSKVFANFYESVRVTDKVTSCGEIDMHCQECPQSASSKVDPLDDIDAASQPFVLPMAVAWVVFRMLV